MIDTHTGGDTHRCSRLARPVGNTAHCCFLVFKHPQHPILGLVTGSQRCSTGSRISHTISSTLGIHYGCIGEGGEAEGLDSYRLIERTEIGLSSIHLVDTHSITDEIEDIFCFAVCRQHHQQQ